MWQSNEGYNIVILYEHHQCKLQRVKTWALVGAECSVCACVRACVRACVCVCMCLFVCVCVVCVFDMFVAIFVGGVQYCMCGSSVCVVVNDVNM